ncbi:MAG: transposase [Myxococcaceae bacterium]|nr:MAG: transposase [Myxococcaceae bacterium]
MSPLMPPGKPSVGQPEQSHRRGLDGINWVLRTGSLWHAMPERYSRWTTVNSRFKRWMRAGV